MLRARLTWTMISALMIAIAWGVSSTTAWADPIGPGFDLFATAPGTMVTLPGINGGMPVPLMGNPFGPGSTDTVVERKGSLPSGATGMIPIELVALSLVSTSPIMTPMGMRDMYVTINKKGIVGLPQPDALMASTGMMTILSHVDTGPGMGGGTFNSFFDVFVDLVFTPPGGDPTMSMEHTAAPRDRLMSTGAMWSHTPLPGYPNSIAFPGGGFAPAGPVSELGQLAIHLANPPQDDGRDPRFVPEPSSLVLLTCAGVAGILGLGRKRLAKRA